MLTINNLFTNTHKEDDMVSSQQYSQFFMCRLHMRVCIVKDGHHYAYNPYSNKVGTHMHTHITPCPECEPITHPMLRAISYMKGTLPMVQGHDLHTTMHHAYHIMPTVMEQGAAQYPHTHTHTKEQYTMHYKATLNTRTTMAWLVLATMCTLLYHVALTYIPLPTWGGLYTLLTVARLMSMGVALMAALTYRYVRTHGEVVLSTRDLGL